MLAPDYLDHAPDRLVLLWQQVEDDILRDVARRISKMDTLTPTANWQLWRYEQTEALRQDVVKKLARYTGKSEAEIRRLMQEAATRAMEAEDEIYYHYGKEPTPFADNAPLPALLPILTRRGRLSHLKIGFCGDLKYGRTVHSLVNALARYEGNEFVFISPEELRVPGHLIENVVKPAHIPYAEVTGLEEAMADLDILYMTRIQKERFTDAGEYERLKGSYVLDMPKMALGKADMAVLHPLPRVNEIALAVDDDPRAAYFEQAQNGVYVRMALIMTLLGLRDPKAPKEEN